MYGLWYCLWWFMIEGYDKVKLVMLCWIFDIIDYKSYCKPCLSTILSHRILVLKSVGWDWSLNPHPPSPFNGLLGRWLFIGGGNLKPYWYWSLLSWYLQWLFSAPLFLHHNSWSYQPIPDHLLSLNNLIVSLCLRGIALSQSTITTTVINQSLFSSHQSPVA